jgi:ParB family transcriptional regulator, chromosome partitioning protein
MSIVTAATETSDAVQPQAEQPPVPTVEMVDPHHVEPEENIRQKVNLDKPFVASVRQYGVLVPVLGRTDPNGVILIRDGQRRLMAAREAGVQLPVYLVNGSDEKTVRIIEQFATYHRQGLSPAEQADAWQQLALEGMSALVIARRTGAKRAEVETGLVVARNKTASRAASDYDLTLEQAAVLVELEDDPDAVDNLREVAKVAPDSFDHRAQELLDKKAIRDEIAKLRAEYEANGVTVVDWPSWDDTEVAFLSNLRTADGEPVTDDTFADKVGYAMAVGETWSGVSAKPVIVGWKEHGLRRADGRGGPARGQMTDEEKVERRLVVANNKAWASAEKVRRNWIKTLLGRKKLPNDAQAFATGVLVREIFAVERAVKQGHPMAATLLSAEAGATRDHLARIVEESPVRTGHVLLAIALGALEASVDRSTWRHPTDSARRFLRQLAAWGYTLSDVEHLVIAEVTSNDGERADATAERA